MFHLNITWNSVLCNESNNRCMQINSSYSNINNNNNISSLLAFTELVATFVVLSNFAQICTHPKVESCYTKTQILFKNAGRTLFYFSKQRIIKYVHYYFFSWYNDINYYNVTKPYYYSLVSFPFKYFYVKDLIEHHFHQLRWLQDKDLQQELIHIVSCSLLFKHLFHLFCIIENGKSRAVPY